MIEISAITKRYGTRIAVNDAAFDVATGRVTGLVGPNSLPPAQAGIGSGINSAVRELHWAWRPSE